MTEENVEPIQEVTAPNEQRDNTKKAQATDNGFSPLLEAVKPLAEIFIEYKAQEYQARIKEADAKVKYFQHASKHNRNVLYAMTAFLIGVIAFMSFLTWMDKVSGDALLFLVGTVVGYLIIFIQKLASPTREQPIEELPS